MFYAIIASDKPDSLAARRAARPDHLRVSRRCRPRADCCWPDRIQPSTPSIPAMRAFTGSLVVAEFDDLDAARAWADADPYVAAGVYQHVQVKPFLKVSFHPDPQPRQGRPTPNQPATKAANKRKPLMRPTLPSH
jgi:uncharacterized protein YciI